MKDSKKGQTTQLGCLHLMHMNCLVSHMKSFPPQTAPAGYVYPTCYTFLYVDKITEHTVTRPESNLFKEAFVSLAMDSGIHPLVPYFSYFIADEVAQSSNDLTILFALMHVFLQRMPSIITCVIAKRLGSRIEDNHRELHDFSTNLSASVCRRHTSY